MEVLLIPPPNLHPSHALIAVGKKESNMKASNNDCPCCNGRGKLYISCCGDDMYPHQDVPLCPSCGEWQGDEADQAEECDECDGTGIVTPLLTACRDARKSMEQASTALTTLQRSL